MKLQMGVDNHVPSFLSPYRCILLEKRCNSSSKLIISYNQSDRTLILVLLQSTVSANTLQVLSDFHAT